MPKRNRFDGDTLPCIGGGGAGYEPGDITIDDWDRLQEEQDEKDEKEEKEAKREAKRRRRAIKCETYWVVRTWWDDDWWEWCQEWCEWDEWHEWDGAA